MKGVIIFFISILLGTLRTAAQVQDLQIGDKIPEAVWEFPLKVAGGGTNKQTITLNDFRGKLIVLDFWSTWCISCIRNMPYLHSLESEFRNDFVVLPVTQEASEKIRRFLSTNAILKPLDLYSVVEDSMLYATFPSQTLPHIILIDKKGTLRAITEAEYISADVLNDLIKNDPTVYIPKKRKHIRQALIDISRAYDDVEVYNPLFYSTVTGFLDGAGHSMQNEIDSTAGARRFSIVNAYINKLYTTALGSGLGLNRKRCIYEVHKSVSKFAFSLDNYWNIDNRRIVKFCYEVKYPLSMSETRMKAKMKQDLDFFFGMDGRIEEREINCLVLQKTGKSDAFVAKGGKRVQVIEGVISNRNVAKIQYVNPLPNGVHTYIRNHNFASIEGVIDRICAEPVPVILNETGYDGLFDVDFPAKGSSLAEINAKFREQGLQLVNVRRRMDMFVLTENGFEARGEELVLTEFGYAYPDVLK